MAQLTAGIQAEAGKPRQIRITVGELVVLLTPQAAITFGTQLIEIGAIARAQDDAATVKPVSPSLIVPS